MLDLYQLTNVELGTCFSIYGFVAFASYFFGGGIADRFAPGKLMGSSLFLTAIGGFYLAYFPTYQSLLVLYGIWGFTTIFLFWAAMIKATSIWGGNHRQGIAFGLLDGGRGLVSYLFGFLGVAVFSFYLADQTELADFQNRRAAFQQVVLSCTVLILIIAALTYFYLSSPENALEKTENPSFKRTISNYGDVIKLPSVWLLMVIVLCAYTGYKITDIYAQYAFEIMGYNEVEAAHIGKNLLGIRIVIGIAIGFIADRSSSTLILIAGFAVTAVGAMVFALGFVSAGEFVVFWISIITTAIGVYGLRTLYFAALNDSKIPIAVTGTAIGLVSLIGYTPDIFMGPLIGYFIDNYDGLLGFRLVFGTLVGFSIIGFGASLALYILQRRKLVTIKR